MWRSSASPDPKILNPRDAIVRITSTAICGSDLHLYDGYIPTMKAGDILGHEFMGEVVEVGTGRHRICRRATAWSCPSPFLAAAASFARSGSTRCATTAIPRLRLPRRPMATRPAGMFGYSHMLGGYAGGQAEYARVPFADVGPIKVPDALDRRAGALPLRHLPDRLHGGRELQHPAGRHRGGLGLRAGRAVLHQERVPARRRSA